MALNLYNTKTRSIEPFTPVKEYEVALYTCGPTVYDFTHIGHVRKYVGDDILKRTLALSYVVEHVMNVTDVGHMTDEDNDAGEDKLEKGATREGKSVGEIAEFYTKDFIQTMDDMNVLRPSKLVRASDKIADIIALIKTLEEKGFTYVTENAVYFDTSKDPNYGSLSGQKLVDKETTREDVVIDTDKKNPQDFVLWFLRTGKFSHHILHWPSPWGDGFPGWHIECSAIAMSELAETIDIHTGGIDHIPVHHENEIAQSECATGHEFARFWIHYEFLQVDGGKMSKSKNNFYRLSDVIERGFSPMALRYLLLQTHYRKPLNFTWEALEASATAFTRLLRSIAYMPDDGKVNDDYFLQFKRAVDEDLNTSKAISIIWELLGDTSVPEADKLATIYKMDEVLGFDLAFELEKVIPAQIPEEVEMMIQARFVAREEKNWALSDSIRDELAELGYEVLDTDEGQRLFLK